MTEKVLQLQMNKERTVFWSLLVILVLSAFLYIYCINATVHNVVSRQNLENEASQLTLKIGSEEFDYISRRNAITLQLAYSLGFHDANVKKYISEKASPFAFASK